MSTVVYLGQVFGVFSSLQKMCLKMQTSIMCSAEVFRNRFEICIDLQMLEQLPRANGLISLNVECYIKVYIV